MNLRSSRVFQLLGLCSGRVVGLGVELHYRNASQWYIAVIMALVKTLNKHW